MKKIDSNNIKAICRYAYLIIPIMIAFILFKYVILVTVTSSGSMEPVLATGGTAYFNRMVSAEGLGRGDIISFWSDELKEHMSKRVIGLPGDSVSFRDGYVFVNGTFLDESDYLGADVETNCKTQFQVPEVHLFVLGDNRNDSYDSRFWNDPYVPLTSVEGGYLGQIPFSLQKDVFHTLSSAETSQREKNGPVADMNGPIPAIAYPHGELPYVIVSRVLQGPEASEFLEPVLEDAEEYVSLPDNCEWNVLEYEIEYYGCQYEDYVNIRIFDENGEPFLNVSPRTFDIPYAPAPDAGEAGCLYAYYPVPKDCRAYSLSFGEDMSAGAPRCVIFR